MRGRGRGGRGGANTGRGQPNTGGIRVTVRGGNRVVGRVAPVANTVNQAGSLSERFEHLRSSKAAIDNVTTAEAGRKRRRDFAANKSRAAREDLLNQRRGLMPVAQAPQGGQRGGRGGRRVKLNSLSTRLGPAVNKQKNESRRGRVPRRGARVQRGAAAAGRGAATGGRGRGGKQKLSKESLDAQLDAYMSKQ